VNRVIIDLDAMRHNIRVINEWMEKHGATWTLVTKVLCGHRDTLRALYDLGVRSVADSRLTNLQAIDDIVPRDVERWYLRLPHASAIPRIIRLTDVSLNSEMEIIEALDTEARKQNRLHRIIVMIELGDLREGILPGSLIKFYQHLFRFENIEVLGIGANLGCLSGAVPSIDQFTQLALYRELLELKFERKLSMISAGTSAVIPLMLEGSLPRGINHFRIGEAAFLGTDLVNGGTIGGLRDDVITLEAEVVELKKKSLVPLGETTTMTPFEPVGEAIDTSPGQRGYRAVVTLGQLDTEVSGLTPLDPDHHIAGASSDLSVINLGDDPGEVAVGDSLRFRPNYGATVRLMSNRYIDQVVTPSTDVFAGRLTDETRIELPRNIEPAEGEPVAGPAEGPDPR